MEATERFVVVRTKQPLPLRRLFLDDEASTKRKPVEHRRQSSLPRIMTLLLFNSSIIVLVLLPLFLKFLRIPTLEPAFVRRVQIFVSQLRALLHKSIGRF